MDILGNLPSYTRTPMRCRGVGKRACSPSFLEEFFSETQGIKRAGAMRFITRRALRNCFAKGNRQDLGVVCRLPSRAVCIPAIPEVAMSRTRRRPYPSDLSDAEWALLEPLLASWKGADVPRSGPPGA